MGNNGNMNGQNANSANVNVQPLLNKIRMLEANNKALIAASEKARRELSGLKETQSSCNDIMRQQQQQILILNTQVSELRKLNGFGGGSSEELLSKQILILKSQRKMLIQQLRELKEQNQKLKNIIVTGDPSAKKPSYVHKQNSKHGH